MRASPRASVVTGAFVTVPRGGLGQPYQPEANGPGLVRNPSAWTTAPETGFPVASRTRINATGFPGCVNAPQTTKPTATAATRTSIALIRPPRTPPY